MAAVLADTHVVIWFLTDTTQLSPTALSSLRGAVQAGMPIYMASISIVEVQYLTEKGRLPVVAAQQLANVLTQGTTVLTLVPLDLGVAQAVSRVPGAIVPDMPDRIIAATAISLGVPLVTKDRQLQAAPITTVW